MPSNGYLPHMAHPMEIDPRIQEWLDANPNKRHPLSGKPRELKPEHDPVDNPAHYTTGEIESIEYIEDKGHGRGFCYGNALKYVTRAPHKGTEKQDLEKAKWYIERLLKSM